MKEKYANALVHERVLLEEIIHVEKNATLSATLINIKKNITVRLYRGSQKWPWI